MALKSLVRVLPSKDGAATNETMYCWSRLPGVLAGVLLASACHSESPARTAASESPTDARSMDGQAEQSSSILCPSLDESVASGFDWSAAFGVEVPLAARVQRMIRLAKELEDAAQSVEQTIGQLCGDVARALSSDELPADKHVCKVAAERFTRFKQGLGTAQLSISVGQVGCSVEPDFLQRCAGECLTGQEGVLSQVECAPSMGGCSLNFSFPNASSPCVAQCAVRSLTAARCTAEIDFDVDGLAMGHAATLEALGASLPRLVALGSELSGHAVEAVANMRQLVDELAASIDELNAAGRLDSSRLVGGAVLAGCVGPRLADALRAGVRLEESFTWAARVQNVVTGH